MKLTLKREPDFIIGGKGNPYLKRWYITPWSGWFRFDKDGNPIPHDSLPLWKRIVRCLPNIYLHQMLRDDDDRALHDHPWANISIILKGSYIEHIPSEKFGYAGGTWRFRTRFRPVFRKATALHRIELVKNCWRWQGIGKNRRHVLIQIVPVWSLFITGFKVREWGFACPKGWVVWWKFVNPKNTGEVGPGCGD